MDPEGPGPVVGRGDHASMTGEGTDHHRTIAVVGAVTFLDAGIEGIEIGVAIAVMAIMMLIFGNLASRGRMDKGL